MERAFISSSYHGRRLLIHQTSKTQPSISSSYGVWEKREQWPRKRRGYRFRRRRRLVAEPQTPNKRRRRNPGPRNDACPEYYCRKAILVSPEAWHGELSRAKPNRHSRLGPALFGIIPSTTPYVAHAGHQIPGACSLSAAPKMAPPGESRLIMSTLY